MFAIVKKYLADCFSDIAVHFDDHISLFKGTVISLKFHLKPTKMLKNILAALTAQ